MKLLDAAAADFEAQLADLLALDAEADEAVQKTVREIIQRVRQEGDAALVELTNQLDGRQVKSAAELLVTGEQMAAAAERLDPLVLDALNESVDRIRIYHEVQKRSLGDLSGWQYKDALGNSLGQQVKPMERVGIYVPGGKAAYPSTVLMTAIPARVAGVTELVLCVPVQGGGQGSGQSKAGRGSGQGKAGQGSGQGETAQVDDVLLAAAHLAGVNKLFTIGGAQAIAALAHGTASIPAVSKIVGPGNIYVTTAKQQVYGKVGIDMIAGPSEVVIIADETANADWVIQDLFAQAEHDEMAQSILITDSPALQDAVRARLPDALNEALRADIIRQSLEGRGAIIQVADLDAAVQVANRIAPEHLQLAVADPEPLLDEVQNAGAVFLGHETAEVVGDYTAGPSHVLPTAGSARFGSPLGVYDFLTRTSIVQCSAKGAVELNRAAAILARVEGLGAHAEAAENRVKNG